MATCRINMTDIIRGSAWIVLFAGVLWYLLRAPKRSEAWRALKLWAEDNEEAALIRETRREMRRTIAASARAAEEES